MYRFFVSFIIIIIAFPILIIVRFLLFISNQGKPFFFQFCPGRNEQLFKIIKFKTMNDKKDSDGNLLPDALRLTGIGNVVR